MQHWDSWKAVLLAALLGVLSVFVTVCLLALLMAPLSQEAQARAQVDELAWVKDALLDGGVGLSVDMGLDVEGSAGKLDGLVVGLLVGSFVGFADGSVGGSDGLTVGLLVGSSDGLAVGESVGGSDGLVVGLEGTMVLLRYLKP
jgi:hypothetical protein